jgi:hypothetical protein
LYKIKEETAKMEKQYTKEYKNNTKTQNTQNIKKYKQENRCKRDIEKHVEKLANNKEKQIIMTQRTAQNLHTAT